MKTNKILPIIRLLCVAAMATAVQGAAKPQLTLLTTADQGTNRVCSFSAVVTPGTNYRLQASTNLSTYNWTEVGSATATATNLLLEVTNAIATTPSEQFFRLVAATVISTNMVVTNGLLLATNLIIDAGVTVSSTNDLTINVTGFTTLNGQIQPAGNLTLIDQGGMDVGTNGLIMAGGNVIIVSSTNLIPTQADLTNTTMTGFGTTNTNPATGAKPLGKPVQLPQIQWAPNVKGAALWVNVKAVLDIGGPNPNPAATPMVIGGDQLDGIDGTDGTGNPAIGTAGANAGSVNLQGIEIDFNGPVVFNLGNGGKGGNADSVSTWPATAVAEAGAGGSSSALSCIASDSVNINAPVTINFGAGGKGGNAAATGAPAPASQNGANAEAYGGWGGTNAHPGSAFGAVQGLGNLIIVGNDGTGGQGGNATATGGAGGAGMGCGPGGGGPGGIGGNAYAHAGDGGDNVTSLTGGTPGSITSGPGGSAGTPTANGGIGGVGMDCCDAKGGAGGNGGTAECQSGNAGQGTPPGNIPASLGVGGDGAKGGKGNPGGAGGNGGAGMPNPPVTNGAPGKVGATCT